MTTTNLTQDEIAVLMASGRARPRVGPSAGRLWEMPAGELVELATATRQIPALAGRRSSRDVAQILELQDLCDLIRSAWGDADQAASPRTGGIDHLRAVLLVENVRSLQPGAYLLRGRDALQRIELPATQEALQMKVCTVLNLPWNEPPSVTFLLLSEWGLLSEQYEDAALWYGVLDVGASLATLQFAASELGLPSTACAATAPAQVARALGTAPEVLGHVCTFAVGGRSSEET